MEWIFSFCNKAIERSNWMMYFQEPRNFTFYKTSAKHKQENNPIEFDRCKRKRLIISMSNANVRSIRCIVIHHSIVKKSSLFGCGAQILFEFRVTTIKTSPRSCTRITSRHLHFIRIEIKCQFTLIIGRLVFRPFIRQIAPSMDAKQITWITETVRAVRHWYLC